MTKCKSYPTLLLNTYEKLQLDDGTGKADETIYWRIVGDLLYLTYARPNIMFVISLVSSFMQNPSKHHVGTVTCILHYVFGSISCGVMYEHVDDFKLIRHVDSD